MLNRKRSEKPANEDVGHDRGRHAEWPSEIPRPGWRDILRRVKDDISQKRLSLIAAGAAFYAFIAIPSTFTALVSLYGLAFDAGDVQRQIQNMRGVIPDAAIELISDQLTYLASHSNKTLGIGLVVSLLIALWSATSSTSSVMTALNVVNEEQEKRGLIKFYLVAYGLTFATVIFAIISLALIAVLPAVLELLPLGDIGKIIASAVRWPILMVLVIMALGLAFRYAPSRKRMKWRWVTWGAVISATLWIVASALFSIYVGQFASYDKTYGSLAGVIVLMMWLYLSVYSVLLGAQLNAEVEHQTTCDSTIGKAKPMGRRGAKMADTLGQER